MATLKTPEDAARHILEIMVHQFNHRAGEVMLRGQFIMPFAAAPWRNEDFVAGVEYAAGPQRAWVEMTSNGLRLTDAGFAEA